MDLTSIIIERIKQEGPISFHDFMEMALYYPALGYYTSEHATFGKEGDYFTSPHLGKVFGAVLGKQIEEMWMQCGEEEFMIVEYGAGEGVLCHDILDYLKTSKKSYDKLRYCIIEKSTAMREKAKQHLPAKVEWHDSIDSIGSITGCVLSNELVDNFAVHRVVMQDELMEVYIDYRDGFTEVLQPAGDALKAYLREQEIRLPKDFRTEINLEAIGWINTVASSLQKGYVITIDYGFPAEELYRNNRNTGTMLCYHRHQISEDPYTDIGMKDITTHVNFSALTHWGDKSGLTCSGMVNQAAFLLGLDFKTLLHKTLTAGQNTMKAAIQEAVLTRTFLLDMGMKLKVLIQQKGINGNQLSGLKYLYGDLLNLPGKV